MSAYSMGKSNKQPSFIVKNQTPGVGAYQTNSWSKMSRVKTSPSVSMAKTKKFFDPNEKSQALAGPGSYNPEKPQAKLMASFKGRLETSYQTQAPSPANYNVQPQFSSKKYSFARSNRKFKTEEGPGPAKYNVNLSSDTAGCSFGKEEKGKSFDEKIPGPGAYKEKKVQSSKGFEQFSFPKEKKFITEDTQIAVKSKVPGPGAYSIGRFKQVFRGGKFNYGQRMTILVKTEGPDPGSYNPKYLTEKKSPQAVIGSQKRQFYQTNPTPGPGAYNPPTPELVKKRDGVTVFPQGERLRNYYSQTPGPGSYEAKPMNQSRAHSISSRHKLQKKQKVPGPQEYKPQFSKTQKNNGCTVFGSQERLKPEKKENPGPGAYKFDVNEHSKTFYFNKSKSKQKLNETVGPGQYKLKPYIGMYSGSHKDTKDILYV